MGQFPKMKQISGLIAALAGKANDSEVVKKSNNLSDLPSKATARANLSVLSETEINNLVAGATQSRVVPTRADFEALTDLMVNERVHVQDDGDGKWAIYLIISTTDGTYANSTVQKIADEDVFDNAMSASAVKASYESNPDTNEFSDSEKDKLGFLGLTSFVDLNAVKGTADSAQADATQAISDASAAHTAAYNAQQTANSAEAGATQAINDAANAQSTADAAMSDAAGAQSTADNALNTANSKMDAFKETREVATGYTKSANTDLVVDLAHTIAADTQVQVFVNGVFAAPVFTAGDNEVIINVPYPIETTDEIVVIYSYPN